MKKIDKLIKKHKSKDKIMAQTIESMYSMINSKSGVRKFYLMLVIVGDIDSAEAIYNINYFESKYKTDKKRAFAIIDEILSFNNEGN